MLCYGHGHFVSAGDADRVRDEAAGAVGGARPAGAVGGKGPKLADILVAYATIEGQLH